MKVTSDDVPGSLSGVEITLDKHEAMEVYRAMAKAEVGDRVVLENGLTFKIEAIIRHGENDET